MTTMKIAVTGTGTGAVTISKKRDKKNYKHSLIKEGFQRISVPMGGYKRSAYKIYEC